MNKESAIRIIHSALNASYQDLKFNDFIANIFKNFNFNTDLSSKSISEAYKNVISKYKLIGSFTDSKKNSIDVLEVTLNLNSSLDRARTTQRNFIASYLKNNGKNAALVSFISPESEDWRFSLVKLDSVIEFKDDKIISKDEISPARRWSFLVGPNEGCHTVISRFISILESNIEPNLAELENAFSIEKVTDEFYEKYKELYLVMKDQLDGMLVKDLDLRLEFQANEIDTSDFAKKTMGQLAFIYFLQKKGWFGVDRKGEWGSGSKQFLRDLFNDRGLYGTNFFNDVLEWLFYDALSHDRGKNSIYPKFNSRIPFLNGGLFEPMNGYSWETTVINFNDSLFSNSNETKDGDVGDGILDVFDRYNFTVHESEPLEKEVAVDPEMLGKVFENLLPIKDRGSHGAFYTPKEIVHYMCQESLSEYLKKSLNGLVENSKIESLVHYGDAEGLEKYSEQIDSSLAGIKVCDPAVGSGAFPLGMLNEIVKIRQAIQKNLFIKKEKYQLKLETISNSLYGVDLQSGAIEIARLRLWLSLAIDEVEPKPLPNLDHKIMQGNSLISKYDGIEMFDEDFINNASHEQNHKKVVAKQIADLQAEYIDLHSNNSLTAEKKLEIDKELKGLKKVLLEPKKNKDDNFQLFIDEKNIFATNLNSRLKECIKKYLSITNRSEKENLKVEIDKLKWDLIELSFSANSYPDRLAELKSLRAKNEKPFFLWKLEFSDVFNEKKGFDIIVGNPPYIDSETQIKEGLGEQRAYITKNYRFATGNWDMYIPFFERGLDLLNLEGSLIFITPDKWIAKPFGQDFRKGNLQNFKSILKAGREVFTSALVDSIITSIVKKPVKEIEVGEFVSGKFSIINRFDNLKFVEPYSFDFLFSKQIDFLNLLESHEQKISDLLMCENACATADCYSLKPLIKNYEAEEETDFYIIVNTGTLDKYSNRWGLKNMTYLKDKYLKPIVLKEQFKGLFKNTYYTKTITPKIIIKGLTKLDASLDINGNIIPGKSTLIFKSNDIETLMFVCALVNSSLAFKYIKEKYASSSYNGGINFTKDMLNNLPLPKDYDKHKLKIVSLVQLILEEDNLDNIPNIIKNIDLHVFKMYGFNYESYRKFFLEESNFLKGEFN